MIIRNPGLISGKIDSIRYGRINNTDANVKTDSFEKVLKNKLEEIGELKFSKHAEMRLKSRNIHLTNEQKQKLNDMVKKADERGINDSVVVMDNMAFVINVKNRIVITAMNGNELKDNVFTNIDGAVIC